MKTQNTLMTVRQAQEYLAENGLDWTEVWIRRLIGNGTIKSSMQFNSRVIAVTELNRILAEKTE